MKKTDKLFVMLTYDILHLDGLTSTDKVILAYRLGYLHRHTPFLEKVGTTAKVLNLGVDNVQKSISKLKRLGHWPKEGRPTQVDTAPTRVGEKPTRVGDGSTRVGALTTRVDNKKSVSPLKRPHLLDESLDEKLDEDKMIGLDGSAQTSFKKLEEEDSVSSESEEIKISTTTGSEAPSNDCHPSIAPSAPPLGPDGRPMTREAMVGANFVAQFCGKPLPYTEAQVKAGREKDEQDRLAETADEFADLFKKRAV